MMIFAELTLVPVLKIEKVTFTDCQVQYSDDFAAQGYPY